MQGRTPTVAWETVNQASWKCDQENKGDVPKQGKELLLMSQFVDGGVTLHIPDRDTQDDTQTAHDEALQAMDMQQQQRSTFYTIEQCGYDNSTENAKLALSGALLLVPEDTTMTAKGLRGLTDPGANLQVRATVFLDDTSQILETRDRFNRGMVGEKMDWNGLCIKTGLVNCHGLGL